MKHFFKYNHKIVFYKDEGEGVAVVLLHGFAEDSNIWDKQIPFLKLHCRLIIPDLPGSGESSLLNNDITVSLDDYAHCIHALLEYLNIQRCIMLGHSMGGYIMLAFAEKYSDKLLGLGFVQSTAYADSEEKKAVRRKGIDAIAEYGSYAFIKTTTPNTFAAKFKQEHPEEVQALIEKGSQFDILALQQYYTAMINRPDRTYILRNSIVPVLFIIGMQDVAVPSADALQQAHMPNESHIHILPEAGHMGIWEATEQVNNYLLLFIQRINLNTRL